MVNKKENKSNILNLLLENTHTIGGTLFGLAVVSFVISQFVKHFAG